MARVVQRNSPPYLLIAFVILFLISTATAVLFWVQADNYKNKNQQTEMNWKRIASAREAGSPSPQLQEMMSNSDKATGQSAVAQLSGQVDDLASLITGKRPTTYGEAKSTADKLIFDIQSTPGRGLVTEAHDLWQQVSAIKAEADNLRAQNEELQARSQQKDQAIEKLTADVTAKIDQLNGEKRALEEKVTSNHENYLEEQKKLQAEMDNAKAELNKEIAAKNEQIGNYEVTLASRDQMVQTLRDELDKKRPMMGQSSRKPDGKIMQVLDRDKICYIDIGSRDRVVPGLTFSVYPGTGIPENGEGKAKLIVTNVKDSVSECRIVEQSGNNPIITGDLVANLAFDPQRVYTFVVQGDFDLRNTGEPSTENAQEVRAMIKKFGGQLADNVDVKTDFVVLGEEPRSVPKPSESAPETSWAVYHAQMEQLNHYQEIKKAAIDLHVPVLNTNRFLALMGYAADSAAAATTVTK
ncbi:MAG: BRCT domain-containing protein [Phycisphaerae bacterium]